jgi:hypothetical protein
MKEINLSLFNQLQFITLKSDFENFMNNITSGGNLRIINLRT